MSDSSHEDVSKFFCWQRHYSCHRSILCNTKYFYTVGSAIYVNNWQWTHCYLSTQQCFTTAPHLPCLLLSTVQPQFLGCAEPNLTQLQYRLAVAQRGEPSWNYVRCCQLLSCTCRPSYVHVTSELQAQTADTCAVARSVCDSVTAWCLFCSAAALLKWKSSNMSLRRGKCGRSWHAL